MKMIQDLAREAFHAARVGDLAGMRAALESIGPEGQPADTAVRAWMDQLLIWVGEPAGDDTVNLKVEMVADDSGTGTPAPPADLYGEVTWVGQLFVTYAGGATHPWFNLRDAIPAGREAAYLERTLTIMAKTTLAYEEDAAGQQYELCHPICGWVYGDPAATGDRLAKSHLN